MNSKIFIGSLSYNVDDAKLKETFEPFGKVVSAKVIRDRDKNRSKGFGFVEMQEAEDAKKAIEALDGSELNGRKITVNEAKPKA